MVSLQPDASMEDAKRVLARFSAGELYVDGRSLTAPISGGAQTLIESLRGPRLGRDQAFQTWACADQHSTMCSSPLTWHLAEYENGEPHSNELIAMKEAS